MEKVKLTFTRKEKETRSVHWWKSGLETAPTRLSISSASTVPLSYTDTLYVCKSLQNWSASRCAFFDQSYAILPNVLSYVQEKYSQGRNGAFPDMVSVPRMTPQTLRHVWLPFVGELLDHPVCSSRARTFRKPSKSKPQLQTPDPTSLDTQPGNLKKDKSSSPKDLIYPDSAEP